jgi:glycine/D-amino acid oxidase-like deaminating enzyme
MKSIVSFVLDKYPELFVALALLCIAAGMILGPIVGDPTVVVKGIVVALGFGALGLATSVILRLCGLDK